MVVPWSHEPCYDAHQRRPNDLTALYSMLVVEPALLTLAERYQNIRRSDGRRQRTAANRAREERRSCVSAALTLAFPTRVCRDLQR